MKIFTVEGKRRRVKNCLKLREVIYGRPLIIALCYQQDGVSDGKKLLTQNSVLFTYLFDVICDLNDYSGPNDNIEVVPKSKTQF